VRVSRVGDRDGERFVSPSEQRNHVHAFAAFATKYLPTEMLDELILSVETTIEAERALPASGWRIIDHRELDPQAVPQP
jgi:hypothetical protein